MIPKKRLSKLAEADSLLFGCNWCPTFLQSQHEAKLLHLGCGFLRVVHDKSPTDSRFMENPEKAPDAPAGQKWSFGEDTMRKRNPTISFFAVNCRVPWDFRDSSAWLLSLHSSVFDTRSILEWIRIEIFAWWVMLGFGRDGMPGVFIQTATKTFSSGDIWMALSSVVCLALSIYALLHNFFKGPGSTGFCFTFLAILHRCKVPTAIIIVNTLASFESRPTSFVIRRPEKRPLLFILPRVLPYSFQHIYVIWSSLYTPLEDFYREAV